MYRLRDQLITRELPSARVAIVTTDCDSLVILSEQNLGDGRLRSSFEAVDSVDELHSVGIVDQNLLAINCSEEMTSMTVAQGMTASDGQLTEVAELVLHDVVQSDLVDHRSSHLITTRMHGNRKEEFGRLSRRLVLIDVVCLS